MNMTSVGKIKENLKLQNAVTLKVIDIRIKNFIFITYSSDSVDLQNFIKFKVVMTTIVLILYGMTHT
jgi:hypothetical protein